MVLASQTLHSNSKLIEAIRKNCLKYFKWAKKELILHLLDLRLVNKQVTKTSGTGCLLLNF